MATSSVLRISEASSLGMHAMALLAGRPGRRVPVAEIAFVLKASEAHLSKVMQRLGRAGLVRSARGPKGGFTLAKDPGRICLKEVYEAIEGPMASSRCLLGRPVCGRGKCILGGLIRSVDTQLRKHFQATSLSDLAGVFEGK